MEIEAQHELQNRIIEENEPVIRSAIFEAMLATSYQYEATGNPNVPDMHRQEIEKALSAMWRESILIFGKSIISEFKEGFLHLETKDEGLLFERIYQEYLEQFGGLRITQIFETTREQIMRIIATGQKEGEGIAVIAKRMRESIPELSTIRAHVIARTETHSAAMVASQSAAKASMIKLNKVWISTEDHRTRDFNDADGTIDKFSHRAINGQTVPIDTPFAVPVRGGGVEELMCPGDPNGSAGNIMLCRCVQNYERDSS